MSTIKKACKGALYPKSSSVSKRLKSGGSFPDLNKDGKVTKKDILIGKGVLPKTAKKGMKVKKAMMGTKEGPGPKKKVSSSPMKDYLKKYPNTSPSDTLPKNDVRGTEMNAYAPKKEVKKYNDLYNAFETKDKLKASSKNQKMGGTTKKAKIGAKMTTKYKTGGKMTKKCMTGCK
jgi:spore maturation protein CgeB